MTRRATTRGLAAIAAVGALVPIAAHAASTVKTVAFRDAEGDAADGAPDLVRVQLGRASDGRLRGVLMFAEGVTPAKLLAKSGPPGSACLRIWTFTRPVGIPPDFLVCITARDAKTFRATVSAEQVDAQPKVVGPAAVSRLSGRTLVVKFSRKSVGSPSKSVIFAAEATKPGCIRVSCVDTAPDAPATQTLKLG